MSYNKQTWNTGDVVTATKLNHIEEGIANASSSSTSSKNSQWQGITIDFMGDSITQGVGVSNTNNLYWKVLSNMLNATPYGYGISGSTISNGSNPMYSRVLNMNKDANLIFVFGGTNDFGSGGAMKAVGGQFVMDGTTRTLNVDVSTFWGGLNQMCLNLYATYPNATFILMTPLHRDKFNKGSEPVDWEANKYGNYLNDYAEAIRKCGEWFSIPVIDLYSTSGLYPEDDTNCSKYFADGLHPNDLGHKVIANVIYEALDKIARKATSL